ncbi:MAG: FAD-dependent oxidoreductase, partial [Acidobacteria bacterium]|nr:FAD-dependent oxidoreductase [Acidobacteriota bacterium]
MKEQAPFDVAIIGAGPGGYVAAIRAAQLGLNTALIDRDARLGGTCLLRGCIPTKILLHDARLMQEFKKAANHGFNLGEVSVDFSKLQERKNNLVNRLAKNIEFLMRKNKITTFKGAATLASATKIVLKGDGATTEVNAKNIIIATGSEAKSLPGYDVDEKRVISNVGALDLADIPKSMLIVGAGAVGVE